MFSSRKEAAATGEPTSPNSGTGLRAHRHPPTDTYSPIVGSVNPIQMYILENAHSPTHPPTGLSDIHHPDIHHLRHSSPQTFISPPTYFQTFITSDIHHLRRSSPQTFITSDIHHLRRSSPQTFITPYLKSDIHHLRRSSPPT